MLVEQRGSRQMLKVVLANQARGAYHTFQHGMPAAVKAVDAAACMQMVARPPDDAGQPGSWVRY